MIAHGTRDDYFWERVEAYVHVARVALGINVRYGGFLDGADQAAAITRCHDDGAVVIASTLADPDAVSPALLAAKAAGVRIISFNSGADFSAAAGAELHIGIDDSVAGRLAGEQFVARGVSGRLACVIHETGNVGLEERCDALAVAYTAGEIERIRLNEGAARADAAAFFAERILDPDQPPLQGALALNGDTMMALFDAVLATRDELGDDLQIAAVGQHMQYARRAIEDKRRHRLFLISDMAETQAYLIAQALFFTHTFHHPPAFIGQPNVYRGTPFLFDDGAGIRDPDALQAMLARLRAKLAAPADWDNGW